MAWDTEVCPGCGSYVERLDPYTGWCFACTRTTIERVCQTCGKKFRQDGQNRSRRQCPGCRYGDYAERLANDRERLLADGYSLKEVRIIIANQQPICLSCGKRLRGATAGRHHFCKTTPDCRFAAGAIKRYRRKGYPEEELLELVLLRLKERRVVA